MANLTAKTIHRMPISEEEFSQATAVVDAPFSWWEHYSGEKDALKDVLVFYRSPEYRLIPYVDVSTRLLSELITGNEAIRSSDVMDIHHMATVLPYASYIVTDKRIKNRIEGKTKLARDYPCRIVKWQEILPLFKKLGN